MTSNHDMSLRPEIAHSFGGAGEVMAAYQYDLISATAWVVSTTATHTVSSEAFARAVVGDRAVADIGSDWARLGATTEKSLEARTVLHHNLRAEVGLPEAAGYLGTVALITGDLESSLREQRLARLVQQALGVIEVSKEQMRDSSAEFADDSKNKALIGRYYSEWLAKKNNREESADSLMLLQRSSLRNLRASLGNRAIAINTADIAKEAKRSNNMRYRYIKKGLKEDE